MIVIDGSYGEGGGQILRSAVALAALTSSPCHIINIRAGRHKPGLQEQHLQAVRAAAALCQAELTGDRIGSQELTFTPKGISPREIEVKISTAGSIGLVLQALSLAAIKNGARIKISGGATFGKWAIPIPYLELVLFPILERFGYQAKVEVSRHGFYPRGGAQVATLFHPWQPHKEINLTQQGKLIKISGISIASHHLRQKNVAERQRDSALKILQKNFPTVIDISVHYTETLNPGSAIVLCAETTTSRLGADSLGERGKPAEKVGTEAAENLLTQWHSGAPLDSHAADQLLPFLALAGGEIKVSEITAHCRTNLYVLQKFLPTIFSITANTIRASR